MRDFRIVWVELSPNGDLGSNCSLVRFGPALHETQCSYGSFRYHPVMNPGVGLFGSRAYPVVASTLVVFGTVMRTRLKVCQLMVAATGGASEYDIASGA